MTVFSALKKECLSYVNQINEENIVDISTIIQKQLEIMILYQEKEEKAKISCCTDIHLVEIEEEEKEKEIDSPKETIEEENQEKYLFERKIKGGILPKINGFVPEGIVRKLGLEDGDFVYAKPTEEENKFIYALAEKRTKIPKTDRLQYNYCPVEKYDNMLVVSRSLEKDEEIKVNELLYQIPLKEDDILYFKIEEGDLIDVAFPKNEPHRNKVLWKYETPTIDITQINGKEYKSSTKTRETTAEIEVTQTLEGRTFLIIGNEPSKAHYKKVIEERGGTFIWADSNESTERIEALVKKADCVIFLLKTSSHGGMWKIKDLCKTYQVPFETTFSLGATTVVRIAQNQS